MMTIQAYGMEFYTNEKKEAGKSYQTNSTSSKPLTKTMDTTQKCCTHYGLSHWLSGFGEYYNRCSDYSSVGLTSSNRFFQRHDDKDRVTFTTDCIAIACCCEDFGTCESSDDGPGDIIMCCCYSAYCPIASIGHLICLPYYCLFCNSEETKSSIENENDGKIYDYKLFTHSTSRPLEKTMEEKEERRKKDKFDTFCCERMFCDKYFCNACCGEETHFPHDGLLHWAEGCAEYYLRCCQGIGFRKFYGNDPGKFWHRHNAEDEITYSTDCSSLAFCCESINNLNQPCTILFYGLYSPIACIPHLLCFPYYCIYCHTNEREERREFAKKSDTAVKEYLKYYDDFHLGYTPHGHYNNAYDYADIKCRNDIITVKQFDDLRTAVRKNDTNEINKIMNEINPRIIIVSDEEWKELIRIHNEKYEKK
jgi:hypothetical protein